MNTPAEINKSGFDLFWQIKSLKSVNNGQI